MSQDLWDKFAHLHDRDVLADTGSCAVSELSTSTVSISVRLILTFGKEATLGPREILTARKFLSMTFSCSGLASIQRSGLNSVASSPQTSLFTWMTGADMLTFVPAGRKCPQMVAPPSGTKRSRGKPTPGWRRIASFMAACLHRYLSVSLEKDEENGVVGSIQFTGRVISSTPRM